ncbi:MULTISPECIES: VPS10 domain-containing protein [Emticicia]|uniref:WD40/YVTN/BNR-like repeat-containing protein n=1 Tax=Emticicia TaxID=312278 RepID=UPI0007D8C54C|nr:MULTISPECIES: sialidase family protein [Emticicia]
MKKVLPILLTLFCFFSISFAQKATTAPTPPLFNPELYKGLKWRNIGPFRGGRSVTATGVKQNPMTYYFGSTGGGIWKTEDAGISWKNISDGQLKTGSVGAITVAESDPNVLYVGMGEHPVRGMMTSHGDGIYKSTDAGKTWKNIGLEKTKHIAAVRIHPTNPDVVYVAAQGALHGPSEDRGIYRTTDGGKTWQKIFYVDANTGCADLSMDMTNPRILYAAMWQHRRYPWKVESGGAGCALYKSVDGGDTWTKMTEGLPKNIGKAAVSVSRANPNRVYANIEAEGDKAGVYRSDDAGKTWTQSSKQRITITRAWYYIEIFADPLNADLVYIMNAPFLKSSDGGRSFAPMRVPHGDNHDLWINPTNNQVMINANDGGANISFNGGASWSSQNNQPTAQFYRVITDNRFPYYVYGGQQDNTSLGTASRTNGAGIERQDWFTGPGCESAYIAFDNPNDPQVIYGGCYQGNIEVFDTKTGIVKDVMAYPHIGLAVTPKLQKYRFNWNAPIMASPFKNGTIYHGGNVVLKSSDNGQTWQVISGDLTRNDKAKQEDGGGPYTNEGAGGEVYNTLAYIAVSPHKEGVLYTGSDCGLVHLTQDDGKTWQNITPKELDECLIHSIEVSPHDPATAYIVATKYRFNDFTPLIYVTKDYGKTWKKITQGIEAESFAKVVREDPKRKGLLYCGTELGFYISYNQGENWQKLQLNLPVVPITDLVIHDNDLVASTAGRAFWILDDLAVLQQSENLQTANKAKVFMPKATVKFDSQTPSEPVPGIGQNPMNGVILDYFLPNDMDSSNVVLQILDNQGNIIRTYDNKKDLNYQRYEGGPAEKAVMPSKKGINRFAWDMRREGIAGISKVFVNGDYRGSLVAPNTYKVRLIAEKDTSMTEATIIADPRLKATKADFDAQQAMLAKIEAQTKDIHNSVNRMRKVKSQIENITALLKDNKDMVALVDTGKAVLKKITAWEENLITPKQETFQDVINFYNRLNAELLDLKNRVDVHDPRPTSGAATRLNDLTKEWEQHKATLDKLINVEVAKFNEMYKQKAIPALIVPER